MGCQELFAQTWRIGETRTHILKKNQQYRNTSAQIFFFLLRRCPVLSAVFGRWHVSKGKMTMSQGLREK